MVERSVFLLRTACVVTVFSLIAACGSDEDDGNEETNQSTTDQTTTSQPTTNDSTASETTDDDQEDAWPYFPLDGYYEVARHNEYEDCENATPIDRAPYAKVIGWSAITEINYRFEWCDSTDEDEECAYVTNYFYFPAEEHLEQDEVAPQVVDVTDHIDWAGPAGPEFPEYDCHIRGLQTRWEVTEEGLEYSETTQEFFFHTDDEPWACENATGFPEDAAPLFQCLDREVIELHRMD